MAAPASNSKPSGNALNCNGKVRNGIPQAINGTDGTGNFIEGLDEKCAEREPSPTEILMTLIEDIDLFHDKTGTAYADVDVKGHRETWSVRSEEFAHWLGRRFFKETQRALNAETLRSSLANFEAQARFEGNISIQPESLSLGGDIQRAGKRRWWEKVKRAFASTGR